MRAAERRWLWPAAVAALVLGALGLRLWGFRHGLPYVYNADENAHFVAGAIGMFGHTYNPNYFINPPAFTYLLHVAFALGFGGRDGVSASYAADPGDVFALARALSGLLGAVAVGLLVWAGTRLFDRRIGFVAAALLAVAFLPVHYGHLALNDVPALAPLCLALAGVGGVFARGRMLDYALAGVGLGLACATKYTGGIVLLPLLAAALAGPDQRIGRRLGGLALAGVLALAAFLVANPFALLDFGAFRDGLSEQSAASSDGGGKLGLTASSGILYYLETTTWGLGWVPALAALGGAVALAVRDWRRALVLVPPLVVFVLFMGTQDRFFARWLLPVYPFACLLAAYGAVTLAAWALARVGRPRPAWAAAAAGVLLCAQGLVFAIHNDIVLARDDTRQLARDWMVGQRPGRDEGGDRAGDARLVGERPGARPARHHRQRRALGQVADVALAAQGRRHAAQGRARADRQARGLRAHAVPAARPAVRRPRLLHRADRLDPVRARARGARGRPAGHPLLRRAQAQRPRRVRRPPAGAQVLVRLLLQQLPALLRPPGAGDRDLSVARRGLPRTVKYPPHHVTTLLQTDHAPLARAIELAEQGRGRTSPNPLVGAVVVRDGRTLGEGWHAVYGGAHAERAALDACATSTRRARRSTCRSSRAATTARRRRAPTRSSRPSSRASWSASDDPTEKASGRGLGILRDEGVEVVVADGELAARARCLNQAFRKHARTGRPQVLFKSAMTLDGKVATRTGDSKWISGEDSRYRAHHWRAERDAVVVGIGTALADDPQLDRPRRRRLHASRRASCSTRRRGCRWTPSSCAAPTSCR